MSKVTLGSQYIPKPSYDLVEKGGGNCGSGTTSTQITRSTHV